MASLLSLTLTALTLLLSLSFLPCTVDADLQYTQSLTLGIPFRPSFANRLRRGNTASFPISLPTDSTWSTLQVTVSPLTAEAPGLYADFNPDATADSAQWNHAAFPVSRATGDVPSLSLSRDDTTGHDVLYATVECSIITDEFCVFSISALLDSRQLLWPGAMTFDKVPAGRTMYYDFKPQWYNQTHYPLGTPVNLSIAADDIHITAVTLRGRISVYVNGTVDGVGMAGPSGSQWRQVDYNNEVIVVPRGDRGRPAGQTFIIAVRADDARTTVDGEAVFSLQVSFRSFVVTNNFVPESVITSSCRFLSDDIPTPGQSLVVGDWDQYCFYVPTSSCPFDVSLTTLSGEQDLYLWHDGGFQEYQAGMESDNLHLINPTPKFYALVIYTPNVTNFFTPGRYNVLYHSNCTGPQFSTFSLPGGIEQRNSISKGAVLSSTAEESVRLSDFAAQFEQFRRLKSREVKERKFAVPDNGDRVVSPERRLPAAAPLVPKVAAPAAPSSVHSKQMVASPRRHLLSAAVATVDLESSYHAIQLTQGQPQFASMSADRVMRFVYQPLSFDDDLTFELRRRSGSDPNFYISTSLAETLPMPTDCMWYANFSGDDYKTIDRMDDMSCKSLGCYYHIAVLVDGDRETGFTLTVSEGEGLTDLQAGQEYSNKLKANEGDYLRFIVQQAGQDVKLTLTDTGRSQPRLYASTRTKFPNATNNQWSLTVGTDGEVSGLLTIRNSQNQVNQRACQPTRTVACVYYMQVISSADTSYSILAQTDGPAELTRDRATEARLGNNQIGYFKSVVSPGYYRWAVSLYLISGLANIFVSNTDQLPVPSQNGTWSLMRTYNQLSTPITIYEDSGYACNDTSGSGFCTFNIAVQAASANVYFSLIASEGLIATVGVRNGLPIRQTIPTNTTYYWHLKLEESGNRFQVCVTLISGDVRGYWSSLSDNTYPDASNYELTWNIQVPGYGCIYNPNAPVGERYFSLTNPSPQHTAVVTVMFLSQRGSNDTNSEIQLTDGVPQAMMLHGQLYEIVNEQRVTYPPNPLIYFNFILSSRVPLLTFTLYSVINDADLYLSYASNSASIRYPTKTSFYAHSNLTGSDLITLPNSLAGRYLGAAFHNAGLNSAVFIVTASTGRVPQMLQDGLAVRGFVLAGQYKLFELQIFEQQTAEITLTPFRGNPDLYAGFDYVNLDSSNAIWRSASTGVDVIRINSSDANRPTASPWTLYVAVHANDVASDFTLSVSLGGSSFLQAGVPTPGALDAGEYHYYQFRPGTLTRPIDITIQRMSGNPALLLSWNNSSPTVDNSWYTVSYEANLFFRLAANATNPIPSCQRRNILNLEQCVYYIGIYAYPNPDSTAAANHLSYSLTVAQPSDIIELRQGFPQASFVSGGQTDVYHFVNGNHEATVVFAVTAVQGDVDIFVSDSTNPGPDNYRWSSRLTGDDVIAIKDAYLLYYYIGVHNNRTTTAQYTLLAKAYTPGVPGSGAIYLTADQTQNDFCAAGDYSYYLFNVEGEWPSLTISITARIGDPDLYVNSYPLGDSTWPNRNVGGYRWGAWEIGSDTIRIDPPAGETSVPQGMYPIAVYATDRFGDIFYSISVSGEGRMQTMYSGTTYTNTLAADESAHYQFQVYTLAYNQLIFSLTSRTGDTDMFISDRFPHVDATNYNWTSRESGDAVDTIVLRNVSDPVTGYTQLHTGWYYVTVVNSGGSEAAQYALYASYGTRTVLVDGQPASGSLSHGGSMMFEALYASGQQFTVTLSQSTVGDPVDLYVSINPDTIIPNRPATYQWSARANSSTQEVVVDGNRCQQDSCHYYIMAYMPLRGPNPTSVVFTIQTATEASVLTLTPGRSVEGSVGVNSYHNYKFILSCPSNVSLFLTALSGDPDLFVNMGPSPPTRFNRMWASDNYGLANDVINFDANHAHFRNRSMVGAYFVSVYGASQLASDYTLVLSVTNQCGTQDGGNGTTTVVRLNNGIPQFGSVRLHGWQYYSFTVSPSQWPTSVTIALSPLDGSDPDMYVTKDGSMPTDSHYAWDALASAGNDDIVFIPANATNPTACAAVEMSCTYIIGVYGYTASAYSITASTTNAVLGLQLDYSRDGGVGPGGWRYYVVAVEDSSQPLVVIVSPTAGNPDLYVEYNRQPTFDSVTSKTFGVDVVTIPEPTVGRYYIGVYGAGSTVSTYSIVASQRGIDLRNGRPQDDALGLNERRYYFFQFNEPTGSRAFRLQIDAISFNPQLEVYVRRDQTPSINNNNFMLSSARGDTLHLVVPSNHSQWRRVATWRVMVISRSENAVYAITAAQGTPPMYLSDGRPTEIGERVPEGESRYFRLLVINNAYPVSVSVTLHYGSASLFLSTSEPLPGTDTTYTWSNSSGTAGSINLIVPRSALPGYVYAGVRSDNGSSSYTIVMTTGVVIMQAGELQAASCTAQSRTNAFVIYLPFNASFTDDVTLSVTPSNAQAANYSRPLILYVTTNHTVSRPSAGNNDWSFNILDWTHPFTISRNDVKLQACVARGGCELRIVVGCTGFTQQIDYLFSVQVGASFVPLMAGQVGTGSGLSADQDRYYTISTSADNSTVNFFQVRVEPCVGNVALYVNYLRGGVPTAGNNDASSTWPLSAQSVTINSPISSGKVLATVRGTSATPAVYRIIPSNTWSFEYLSPTVVNDTSTLWVANPSSVVDGSVRISFLQARAPQAIADGVMARPSGAVGLIRYTIFWHYEPNTDAVMFTACGLNRTNIGAVYAPTQMTQSNSTVTFKVPSDVRRYTINVLAQYVWRTGSGTRAVDVPATDGYLVYRYATGVLPGQSSQVSPTRSPWDDESSSSSGKWYPPHPADYGGGDSSPSINSVVLAFAIGVPVFVLICAIILFLHMKHQHIHDNGGVELNESFFTASTRGAEKFNPLVEEEPDTGGYVPPGGHFARTAAGGVSHQQPLAHHAGDTNGFGTNVLPNGGGDYGGLGGGEVGGHGWGGGSAQSHYAAQAASAEHEHISGRGFYEL